MLTKFSNESLLLFFSLKLKSERIEKGAKCERGGDVVVDYLCC